jgi:murein DD-endopeptidase MepM/ murein hydrolase activator NlpD
MITLIHPCPWNRDRGVGVGIDFGDIGPRYPGGYHYGIDMYAPVGSPILAAAAGLVIAAEPMGDYGNCIHIYHEGESEADRLFTIYGHLEHIGVAVGDSVSAGQQIGTCGSTGNSRGPHLHFEVRDGYNDKDSCIDPMELIQPRPAYYSGAYLRRS